MKRVVFTMLGLLILAPMALDAAVYKGQREFLKHCKECHDNGQEIAATFKKRTWQKLMEEEGGGLAELHLTNTKAQKSWAYFKDEKYRKKAKHLKDFLMEYAKDSGNVPACN